MLSNDLSWLTPLVPPEQFTLFSDAFQALEDVLGKSVYDVLDQAQLNVDQVETSTVITGLRSDVLEMSYAACRKLGVYLRNDLNHNDQPTVTAILQAMIQIDGWEDYFGLKSLLEQPLTAEALFAAIVEEITLVPTYDVSQVIGSVKEELPTALNQLFDLKIAEFKLEQPGIPSWVAKTTLDIKRLADGYSAVVKLPVSGIFLYVQEGGELGKSLETYAEMFVEDVLALPTPQAQAYHWLGMYLATGLPKELYYDQLATLFDKHYDNILVTSRLVKTLKTLAS